MNTFEILLEAILEENYCTKPAGYECPQCKEIVEERDLIEAYKGLEESAVCSEECKDQWLESNWEIIDEYLENKY